MERFKFYIAFVVAKILYLGLKITGHDATHFPGRIATDICPNFLKYIKKPKLVIGVTGTNGKTTVTNMIIDILEDNGYKVLSNRKGSNIDSGIVSALISSNYKEDIAVFEMDERSAKGLYPYIKPKYIVCTNLFRDSIVRNAHPFYILDIINSAIPEESTLILNANDILCSSIGKNNRKIYYGIGDIKTYRSKIKNKINDVPICPECQSILEYNFVHYHHLGQAKCNNCGFTSPKPDYLVDNIDVKNKFLKLNNQKYSLVSESLFNIYNEAAVIAFLSEFGLKTKDIKKSLSKIKITESRYTKEKVNNIEIIVNMSKGMNAIACSRVFDYINNDSGDKAILLMLDDVFDAKNSSEPITWIYETDFEFLNDKNIKQIIVGGVRSLDYKFRLLLAGVDEEKITTTDSELDMHSYLKMDLIDKVYILHDMYALEIANKVKKQLIEDITSGGNL